MFEKNGHRGRPQEDQFERRLEIYAAAAPIIEQAGARRLTMRQVAKAANMSVGAVYHYFPRKRDLVLYPLQPAVCEEMLKRFEEQHGQLRVSDPQRYIDLFVEEQIQGLLMPRPAVQAAFELGAGVAWQTIQDGFDVEMRDFVRDIQRLGGPAARHDAAALERAIRRLFLSAVLDRTATLDEVRAEFYALIQGRPLGGAPSDTIQRPPGPVAQW